MYRQLQDRLAAAVREFVQRQYAVELENVVVNEPPSVELGEYALTFAFELAKKLRKVPRAIAQEVVSGIGSVPGFTSFEVAGGGYVNARLDRAVYAAALASGKARNSRHSSEKVLVEHTSINPNKAAHIGHLRNSILGDTFVRMLRSAGYPVDVQNYIDNTGVQVADVVVGFMHLEKKSAADVQQLILASARPGSAPFDYYCWDLYAHVSQWYEQSPENKAVRLDALHQIERGGNEAAEIAEMVSSAVLRRHLETMQRLDILYDFLPRESEILHLDFWDAAFTQMKERGVLTHIPEGKNKGCWVMVRAGGSLDNEEDQKVIVRSNGTVTYVGKDIAYHLWKFGKLGKDFGYRKFFHYVPSVQYPQGHDVWMSAEQGESGHPHFGDSCAIYNVIDSRQADPQNNVIEAIRALGYEEAAAHYTHFSYEMVALTPRCALQLGYQVSEEDRQRAYIEVSGRKGFGVKADDLMDKLIASARAEVDSRHPELSDAERHQTAIQIAMGALRYFMLKFTKNSVIAFDFKDALSFEGETGPYCQYAVVRASNIFRKAGEQADAALSQGADFSQLSPAEANDMWELWLTAGKLDHMIDQCITTTEPAYLAKYAFQLAQQFNNFYHRHHILSEEDATRKALLLATAALARRELMRALEVMGVESPAVM
jgi:arginyl-tRNA synthetase